MDIPALLRNGIATARKITLSAHVEVTHHMWTGQTFDGTPSYTDVTRLALVERKQKMVKSMSSGKDVMSHTYIGIIEPIAPVTATLPYVRVNPVDANDTFTIPDGTTVNVLNVDGFFDGGTGAPFYSQVFGGVET